MTPLDFTIEFVKTHGLQVILLQPRQKRPPAGQFPVVKTPDVIRAHVELGGNIGILARNCMILDFDDIVAMRELFINKSFLPITVATGSGKFHVYLQSEELPARMMWGDKRIGEIQRGENQYVVCPPSIHPCGDPYIWKIDDPTAPLYFLPDAWREWLNNDMAPEVPEWLKPYLNKGFPKPEEWGGELAEVYIARALQIPYSKRRKYGVKFQCAGCAAEGRDRHRDNACVFNDGHWSCAVNSDHIKAVGESLGFKGIEWSKKVLDQAIKDAPVEDIIFNMNAPIPEGFDAL